MKNTILLIITVHLFLVASSAWATGCGKNISKDEIPQTPNSLLKVRVNEINSIETFSQFLVDIGQTGVENRKHVEKIASLLYRDLDQDGVRRIARNLLLNHAHRAKKSILQAMIGAASEERLY